ncbi:MAG TPA: acetate uptake transporter [Spirochaetota bacterium]|nr:acetate uptake transporter [Spirochaetota bacterium]
MSNDNFANPAPVGLLGFGMTTILLNFHNAGLYSLDAMILGMGVFFGGLAQLIAGTMEFKKGNTFGQAAFMSYGAFWMLLVFLLIIPKVPVWAAYAASETAMATFFGLWGVYTFFMFIGTLNGNRATQTIFLSLTILFFLLMGRDILAAKGMVDLSKTVGHIAGYEGIFCGLSAFYTALGEILNEKRGKTILPLG